MPRGRRRVCPGGTLLEIAVHQGVLDRYVEWLRGLGIDHVEVSNGSLPLARRARRELIAELAREFTVIAEVGSKSEAEAVATTGARRCSATSRPARCW